MKERHLYRAFSFQSSDLRRLNPAGKDSIYISSHDEKFIHKVFEQNNIAENENIAVIAPGARSHTKRWPADKFIDLIYFLTEKFRQKVFLAGDKEDIAVCRDRKSVV